MAARVNTMRPQGAHRLDQHCDDMGRSSGVPMPTAEIDDVRARAARAMLHAVHFGEQIGRQA